MIMTGLLFVIFVIAPLQHCVVQPQPFDVSRNKVAEATELKNKVADAHNNNNVLHLADELTKNCHAHLDRSYFDTCNRPFGQPPGPDVEDSVWDFDFQLPICVALYDASLRICNSTNQNIKYQAFNSTVLQSSLQQDERYGSKICENMRTALVESPFEKTKDWMIVFKKKISEDGACEHKCLSVKGDKINPLCMVILWVHIVARDLQNQSIMEDDNPTGISGDLYYSQIHGSDQVDSVYNTYIPSAPPLSENVLPSGNSGFNLATNTDADPDFQYDANNEDNVEQNKKNSPPNIDSVEKVPDNPISHRLSSLGRPMQSNHIKPAKAEKHGKIGELAKKNSFNSEHQVVNNLVHLKQDGSSIDLIKIKPDGNTEVKIESDGKSSDNKKPDVGLTKSGKNSDNKKPDAGLTKSDGITVSQSSQITNKETSNTDVKKEVPVSNIDVSSVSPVSGQLEKNEASITKNEMKSNTTPLSSETRKTVTHLPDKSIVSTVNNTAVTANTPNSKLLVHENLNSSVTNTSLNKQMLNSGNNVSGKITDAPIENNDIKSQTSVPPTGTEASEKDVEQEENQNEDKYGANSPGFGEDEDVGGDGGEGEDGDVGTGGGDEDDDDINIVADSEINQQTATNENVIVTSKFVDAEGSPFFAYFMTMVVICIIGYLVFHNKQKIMALALEGRSRRGSRRRPNTAGYRKLDSNLEEAVTSACSTSVTHVIY